MVSAGQHRGAMIGAMSARRPEADVERVVFADPFCPPVIAQHARIEAERGAGRPVSVVLDDAPAGAAAGVPAAVRRRWLETIHPGLAVLSAAGGFGSSLERVARPCPSGGGGELVVDEPVEHWGLLHPVVQGALTVRVCVIGAESTGKTTLVRALSTRHATNGVEEYGREYTIEKKEAGTNDSWTTEDFVVIARGQQRLEDEAAIGAGPLFFCDTDAMTTALWHERYQGEPSVEVEELGRMRTYDLFVLCDIDIPWEHDEIRLGSETRAAMHQRFLDVLDTERTEPWVMVSGTVDERIAVVESTIDRLALLTPGSLFDPRRQHLH
jgi:nicotinamide riboside kinase